MSTEVQVAFKTNLPEQFAVPSTQIQLGGASTNKDLSSVLRQLMSDSDIESAGRKFQFMVNDTFLTSTLVELMERLKISNESAVEVFYSFALEKPKPKHTSPQDEWVGSISTHSLADGKAHPYVVGLMNGDLKLFD